VSRVVVITGATAGVGRASARAFAQRGDAVALLARGEDRLEATRRELEAAGARTIACPVDVADAAAVQAAADRVERELGPVDVWVNCAMASVLAFVHEIAAEDFRRVTDVTYLGYVHGTLAALERMRPRDRGVIVMVGSALSYRGIPLQAPYCAAKHAVRGFSDALRCELRHEGSAVRVTAVHLPGLDTPQFGWVRTTLRRHPQPVAPFYEPELAADAVLWAADHPRREHFVAAPTAIMIALNRLAPGLLDRYLARTNVDAQQADIPIDPDRPDDLYAPLPGDRGARGRFSDEARTRSLQWTIAKHRPTAAACAAVAFAGAAAVGMAATPRRRCRRRRPAR
jgi:NAD(P)-dependent dehydrogenase (short-subunit alcohol dehydrogenase family)